MNESNFDIQNYSFVFPNFSEDDWMERINVTDGFNKSLLITQIRVLNLIKSINDKQVTPARLAWVNLWTKCMSLLDGTFAALAGESTFILEVLGRIVTETLLHTLTIADPIIKSQNEKKESIDDILFKNSNKIFDRLCAYTAWTLSSDVNFIKWEHMKKANLDMIWDPDPARSIKYNLQEYNKYREIFGDINIEIDSVSLKNGRKKQEEDLRLARKRIEIWLNHPDLFQWQQKIRKYNEQLKPNTVSFFTLFNEDEKTIRRKMQNIGFGIGYLQYKKASLLIHGSTIEQMNITNNNKIFPITPSSRGSMEASAELVRSECNSIALLLEIFRRQNVI
jgi:hypothetical protein